MHVGEPSHYTVSSHLSGVSKLIALQSFFLSPFVGAHPLAPHIVLVRSRH